MLGFVAMRKEMLGAIVTGEFGLMVYVVHSLLIKRFSPPHKLNCLF